MVEVPKIKIQEIATDPAPTLAGIAVPHTRASQTWKVGGETLAELVHADLANLDEAVGGVTDYIGVDADGIAVRLPDVSLNWKQFEAVGDGVADDTVALNALFAAARALITSSRIRVKIDLNGGKYKVTGNGLNMSGLQCWNLEVCNGVILGHTTGKPVIDLVGSRGYVFRNVLVYGDATDTPTLPFLCARGTLAADGFCDNNLFDNVTTLGYWSVAAFYAYAQETTTHLHCRYWNYRHNAHVAIFEGYDSHPQTSVNKTVLTGGASFINCKYINCDFRYLPSGKSATITGISKANPAVITCASHPFVNGDTVIVASASGMKQINGLSGTVANATATTFELTGINSTAFSTWTSGGLAVKKATQPAIYMNRMKQHSFDTCYVVAYGDDAFHLGFPDTQPLEECTFDFLIEGACERSGYRLLSGTGTQTAFNCSFKGYNTHIRGALFSTDTSGAGIMVLYGGSIVIASHSYNTALPLVTTGSEAEFAFYAGIEIEYPNRSNVLPTSYTSFRAILRCQDGDATVWGHKFANVLDGAFTPTVTASVGTITTVGALDCYAKYEDDFVQLNVSVTITDNGTGTTVLRITLPFTPADDAVLVGSNFSTGIMLQGRVNDGVARIDCVTYSNAYPVASGQKVILSGRVRRS